MTLSSLPLYSATASAHRAFPDQPAEPVPTYDGLPAHVLLIHFVIVLAPLTAILAIICALPPTARRCLVLCL